MTRPLAARLDRLADACLALPEVVRRPSHGTPTFFVGGRRSFLTIWPDGHHAAIFPQLWCAAADGEQELRCGGEPEVFFRPPYVGHRGWLGVRLDRGLGEEELAALAVDAYRAVAPARLVAALGRATMGG